jgi:hypothetical protein
MELTRNPTRGPASFRFQLALLRELRPRQSTTGQGCGVAAAQYARKGEACVAVIQTALREQGALIDGNDLPAPVELQKI